MSAMLVKAVAVIAVAVPTLLLVAGSVLLAVCLPFVPAKRRRPVREALNALTQLADVIQPRHTTPPEL
ncbi:MAG: hypothetical protein ACRDUY_07870 [Nitriliruptorales bacterium]